MQLKTKIEANAELGLLSKKLAAILLDCPVTFDAKDYELSKPDVEKTDELFQELEFRQMKAQFDKYFGTGKEYDEIDTNGNGNTDDSEKSVKKAPAKKSNEDQFDLFGFSDEESWRSKIQFALCNIGKYGTFLPKYSRRFCSEITFAKLNESNFGLF